MTVPVTIRLQQADFDAAREIAAMTDGRSDVGAVVSFSGVCRGGEGGDAIDALTLEHYPGMAEAEIGRHVEEALERLTEAYMAMGITNEAQTAAAVLGHNFPDSPWYKDAYTLLQSHGLEPREDRGSYISRAFDGFQRAVGGIVGLRF